MPIVVIAEVLEENLNVVDSSDDKRSLLFSANDD